MGKSFRLIWLCCCLCLGSLSIFAQAIRAKAAVNKDHILVGEPVLLTLEAECPSGSAMKWYQADSLPHFEYLDTTAIDTLSAVGGKVYKQVLTITSYDSGTQVIPMLTLTVNNKRYLTDSLKIEVSYSTPDSNQPYHDIKDIIEVPSVEPLYVNYIIAVITILAIVAIVMLLRRKKTVVEKQAPVILAGKSPFEAAIAALELARNGYSAESFKSYITELNDIFRQYLSGERIVSAPDASNADLVVKLQTFLAKEELVVLAQQLRLADAVKFARYHPQDDELNQVYGGIKTSIEQLNHNLHHKASI
jgi:hypothetical protein